MKDCRFPTLVELLCLRSASGVVVTAGLAVLAGLALVILLLMTLLMVVPVELLLGALLREPPARLVSFFKSRNRLLLDMSVL